ncbi:MAG: undecaprenyl-diphosphatase [Burkholderiales bacterium]|nr:undecaprenyl-diphosphatase [Burkholderiales bacterium]
MESLNTHLFLLWNAPAHPAPFAYAAAVLCAEYLIWLVPLGLMLGWLKAGQVVRQQLLLAALAGLAALVTNQLIGLVWYHPRPFEIGLGHTLVPHVLDSSFPSDHLTLLWAVAFALFAPSTRPEGIALAIIGLPVAWARIYLGVHYPFDMLGAALVATVWAWVVHHGGARIAAWVYPLVLRLYRVMFAPLIRRGWVLP